MDEKKRKEIDDRLEQECQYDFIIHDAKGSGKVVAYKLKNGKTFVPHPEEAVESLVLERNFYMNETRPGLLTRLWKAFRNKE